MQGIELLQQRGWAVNCETVLATELGSAVARRRWVIWAFGPGVTQEQAVAWSGLTLARSRAKGVDQLMLKAAQVPKGLWTDRPLQLDPGAGAKRDPLLPRAIGRIGRELVYSTAHPVPTWRSAPLVAQAGGSMSGVRYLAPQEAWRLHGGTDEFWSKALDAHHREAELVAAALRAGPSELPTQVVDDLRAWAAVKRKVGLAADPESVVIHERMLEWVQAWKVDPEHPSRALPEGRIRGRWRPEQMYGSGPGTASRAAPVQEPDRTVEPSARLVRDERPVNAARVGEQPPEAATP